MCSVAQSFLTLCDPTDCSPQAPLSMGFSRQEYWSGLSFPSPGDLPNQEIEPAFPTWQVDFLPSVPPGKPKCIEYQNINIHNLIFGLQIIVSTVSV